LHEGLIKIGASLNGAGFCLIEEEKIEKILSHDRTVYDSDFSRIKNKISPHLKSLEAFLQEEGAKKYPQLEASLKKAGDQAAEKTRELIKEQIEQVKSKLKTWDMDKALNQMRLDLGEEYEDKASDMNDLRIRLDELYEERKTEPKRLEEEYEIASHRTYPIAYQLIVPAS